MEEEVKEIEKDRIEFSKLPLGAIYSRMDYDGALVYQKTGVDKAFITGHKTLWNDDCYIAPETFVYLINERPTKCPS